MFILIIAVKFKAKMMTFDSISCLFFLNVDIVWPFMLNRSVVMDATLTDDLNEKNNLIQSEIFSLLDRFAFRLQPNALVLGDLILERKVMNQWEFERQFDSEDELSAFAFGLIFNN